MRWAKPPKIKIYEAVGTVVDGRVEINGNSGKVFSSSGNKFYSVEWDGGKKIICNDNASYYVGYLGYPAIAFLIEKKNISFSEMARSVLGGIKWKDLNTRFKNDYLKLMDYVNEIAAKKGFDPELLSIEMGRIYEQITSLEMETLGEKVRPPVGY